MAATQGGALADRSWRDIIIPLGPAQLAGRIFPPAGRPLAAAVISHGLFSSMQSQKLTRLARTLARAGYLALMYDARGCGASPGQVRETTLTSRREEFLAAADAVSRLYPDLPLVYLGSSMGGCAALASAGVRPPVCLALWSTPLDLLALVRGMTARPQPPDLPLILADLRRHDLASLLAVTAGIFFVHGMEDEVVPMEQARWGHGLAPAPKGLLLLPEADHRLSRGEDQQEAVAQTLAWVNRRLQQPTWAAR